MAPPGICPQCGERLPADVPYGVCPKCMLGLGFDDPSDAGSPGEQPTLDPGSRFAAPAPAELAAHFPQLEILDLIGQGGMGAVYRVRQKTLDRIVALKILPPEVGRDPAFAERFTREAQSLARLTHPNIVMVFDFGESDGYFYFLMEYVDGVNLRQSLNAGHLSARQALRIVPQICDALQYAHDEGIVHRDIKPENVLLDKRGNVKIADFGIAKLLGATQGKVTLTGTGQVMGTPHYMAPEQIEKPTEVDHRADIYSLGVVFYELLTGELPLGRFAPPSQKTDVSTDLDQIVLRTLEKEPNQRYQHASDVKTAVRNADHAQHASEAIPRAEPTVRQPTDSVPEESRKLRVPFTIAKLYGGLAKASGCIRFDGKNVSLEFEVKDDVLGYVSSGIKNISIPLSEIVSLQLKQGLFVWINSIEITTDQLSTLKNVPRSEQGRAKLQIARRDLPLAKRFATAVQRVLNPNEFNESTDASLPPILQQDSFSRDLTQVAADAVRGPAMGLLAVGILCLLTIPMLPSLAMYQALFTYQPNVDWKAEATVTEDLAAASTQQTHSRSAEAGGTSDTSLVVEAPPRAASAAEATSATSFSVAPPRARVTVMLLVLVMLVALLQLVMGVVVVWGAVKMRKLESYSLSTTASILGGLPIHPWFLIGLPIGVWSLFILNRRETKEAFRLRQRMTAPPFSATAFTDNQPLAPAKPATIDASRSSAALRTPATALVAIGATNAALTIIAGLLLIKLGAGGQTPLILLSVPLILFSLLVALLQLKGAVHMLRLQSYTFSTIGAIAAILPLTVLWFITLPLGIWALVLLQRAEIQHQYAATAAGRGSEPMLSRDGTKWTVLFVLLIAGMLAGALVAGSSYFLSPHRVRVVEPPATVFAEESPDLDEKPNILPTNRRLKPTPAKGDR